ncbi:MAG TPA: hypothetical protein VFQ65_25445 [Kofleriaceae bacterium]|nr:hypothetical protein [Kofleriaceae bacterium]
MKYLVVTLALAGCAQIFGLDTTTAPNIDAPGPGAHVTIMHESIGATVADAPATGATVSFLVSDGAGGFTSVPATATAAGQWDGAIPAGNPLVDFKVDGARYLWSFPTRDLHVVSAVLEHPDPMPAPMPAMLTLNVGVSMTGLGEAFTLYTVGAWSVQGLADPPMVTALTQVVDYTMSTPIGGRLDKLTPADAVLVYRRRPNGLPGGGAPLDGVYQTNLAQTGDDTLTGTLADTAVDKMLDASFMPNVLATRYTAVRPAVGGLAMGIAVVASPGYARGSVSGPTLNDLGIAMTDTAAHLPYGNPFASLGWNELVFFNSYEVRTVMIGMTPMTRYAGEQSFVAPAPGLVLDWPAGLPETISLASTPLTTDNMLVTVDPTKYLPVTLVNDKATNTFVSVDLYEVKSDATGAVTTPFVIELASTDPTALVLPPGVLVAGHSYFFRAVTHQGGFPNIATGDLATAAPPFHVGYNDSGVFTVEMP